MELAGNLKQFPVVKVFQFLNMDNATGMLVLRKGKNRISIAMEEGNILDVEDLERPKEQRMREILINAARLTEVEFDALLEERHTRLVPVGTVLVDHGYLNKDEHMRLSKLVYSNILFEAMALNEGMYDFERKENVTPTELPDPISVASIMLNAARQEDEWPTIRRYIPFENAVFMKTSDTNSDTWQGIMESLSPEDQRIARLIDGINTVRMVSEATFSSEFDVSRLLSEFSKRGLIIRSFTQESAYSDARPSNFFSFRLGSAAIKSLVVVTVIIIFAFIWKFYVSPFVLLPEASFAPIEHAGRNYSTVNQLRLLSLQQAFYTYLKEQGTPPASLAVLARMGYCRDSDLRCLGGGQFVLKLLGLQENTAQIQGITTTGDPIPYLTVEITIH